MSARTAIPSRLGELEGKIEAGLKTCATTFLEIGVALTEIRDSRLYQREHHSFDDYCQARWEFTKQYAHSLIKAAAVVQELARHTTGPLPVNASQARALASLVPGNRLRAWEAALEAAGGQQPSARLIVEGFKTRAPKAARPSSSRRSSVSAAFASDSGNGAVSDTFATPPDEDPKLALARLLWGAQELLLEARTALAQIKKDSKFDNFIAGALTAIGNLRFALNNGGITR